MTSTKLNEEQCGRWVHKSNAEYLGEQVQRRAKHLGWTGVILSPEYSALRYEYATEQARAYLQTLAPAGYRFGLDASGHWGLWAE